MSPSASHLLAFTICTTLINCFPAIIGAETPVMTHGQKLSILFALASSIAPALHGLENKVETRADVPCLLARNCASEEMGSRRPGESIGEEKERRYSPMKNNSFMAQKMKRTV
jgi:hypothetical protein